MCTTPPPCSNASSPRGRSFRIWEKANSEWRVANREKSSTKCESHFPIRYSLLAIRESNRTHHQSEETPMREAVIVSYARTGLAKAGRGGFNNTSNMAMLAH